MDDHGFSDCCPLFWLTVGWMIYEALPNGTRAKREPEYLLEPGSPRRFLI